MVFVVAVHSMAVLDRSSEAMFVLSVVCEIVFLTANALFFLLSGGFNLRERATDEQLKTYYLKRFGGGVLIPALILFLIRTLYDLYPNFETVFHVGKEYVKNALGAFSSTEY